MCQLCISSIAYTRLLPLAVKERRYEVERERENDCDIYIYSEGGGDKIKPCFHS